MSNPRTLARIAAALSLITEADGSAEVRFANAYAHGYLDALYDESRLNAGEVQRFRDHAQRLRDERLAELSPAEEPAPL